MRKRKENERKKVEWKRDVKRKDNNTDVIKGWQSGRFMIHRPTLIFPLQILSG